MPGPKVQMQVEERRMLVLRRESDAMETNEWLSLCQVVANDWRYSDRCSLLAAPEVEETRDEETGRGYSERVLSVDNGGQLHYSRPFPAGLRDLVALLIA